MTIFGKICTFISSRTTNPYLLSPAHIQQQKQNEQIHLNTGDEVMKNDGVWERKF